jgi:hypothetical protein
MKLKIVLYNPGCAGGDCPTVYQTDRNTFIVQGYKLSNEDKEGINFKSDEDLIEVPIEFFKDFFAKN